jgi:hypothetical protein
LSITKFTVGRIVAWWLRWKWWEWRRRYNGPWYLINDHWWLRSYLLQGRNRRWRQFRSCLRRE